MNEEKLCVNSEEINKPCLFPLNRAALFSKTDPIITVRSKFS